jgi:hypothetical protein
MRGSLQIDYIIPAAEAICRSAVVPPGIVGQWTASYESKSELIICEAGLHPLQARRCADVCRDLHANNAHARQDRASYFSECDVEERCASAGFFRRLPRPAAV